MERKVLFICNSYFGLDQAIFKEIKKLGHDVRIINECPTGAEYMKYKVLSRMLKIDMDTLMYRYYDRETKKIEREKVKYDILIVIRGEYINQDVMTLIENRCLEKKCKKIHYLWDSFINISTNARNSSLYDYCYSFDDVDCENNPSFEFLPLFWIKKEDPNLEKKKYDIATISSFSDRRYQFLKNFLDSNLEKKIVCRLFITEVGKIWHGFNKYKNIHYFDEKLLIHKKMSRSQIDSLYNKSKAILDIGANGQNGLSIRIFECISAGQKIVTTNKNITKYDFYKFGNIYLIDDNNLSVPNEWLNKPFENIPDLIIDQYSLSAWVNRILENVL